MDMLSKKGLGWIITAVVLLAMAAFCVWYVNDYYHAEDYVDAYLQSRAQIAL